MLTTKDIDALAAGGETLEVEFKGEERELLPDRELVEAVVCLANGQGGVLLLGVEDDGRITGARSRHGAGRTDLRRVEALINNRTRPSLSVQAELVRHGGLEVLALHVPRATTVVGTSDGRYLRRVILGKGEPGCIPYFAYEMGSGERGLGGVDPTQSVVKGATWDDLDPLELERMRRFIQESGGRGDTVLLELSDLGLAKALGAVEANGAVASVRLLGLLLFGREASLAKLVPTHEAAFQVLDGTSVGVNDFFRWPLFRLFEELAARFAHRNHREEIRADLFRVEIPDYSASGFREALANAMVHRDYAMMGAIHIQWHEDHLRLDSPGGFPEGVHLGNLLVTPPRARNPMLADAFKRAGLVERTGRGIDTIFEEQLRYGRPVPSYALSSDTAVTVILPGGPANLDLARFVADEGRGGKPIRLHELLVLNELQQERSISAARVAELIQHDEADGRRLLARLVERGLIEARGPGSSREYHLTAPVYRALGEPAGYVRTRGFEPEQQEQMVFQYVKAHGRITRAEAADLCRISGPQATRLLKRVMKKHPKFKQNGRRRGTHYTLD